MIRFFNMEECRRLLALMLPLFAAYVLQMTMGVIDTIVAGQAGPTELAGVAMGNSSSFPFFLAAGATISIIGPIISRLRGEGRSARIGHILNNGKILAAILGVLTIGAMLSVSLIIPSISSDAQSATIAQHYIYYLSLGIPALIMQRVIQSNFEGHSRTRPAMVVGLFGALLNYPLNVSFVFGWGPIPAMGGAGCGLATALINIANFAALFALSYSSSRHRGYIKQMLRWRRIDWKPCKRILTLGIPLGFATLAEASFFGVVTLIIAALGVVAVGAQQIAISVSSIIFMFPLSMSIAASIRAAYHIGQKDATKFKQLVATALVTTLCGVSIIMCASITLRYPLLRCYTDETAIIDIAQLLIILCALYQIPDAIQALMNGILRGCHDTRIITAVTISCYWMLGVPLSFILIRTDLIVPAMGPAGAWVSFIVALTATAILLSLRLRHTTRKMITQGDIY